MDKVAYLHQWNYGLRERSPAEFVETLRLGGFTTIAAKVLDGPNWMGLYDQVRLPDGRAYAHPLSFMSLDDVHDRYWQFSRHGIRFRPWVNVTPERLADQGQMWRDIAQSAGGEIELDVEPYDGFLSSNRRAVVPSARHVVAGGEDLIIDAHLSKHTREVLPLRELAEMAVLCLGQDYWTTFRQTPTETVEYAAAAWQALGARAWGSIFPWDGPSGYAEGWRVAESRGAQAIGLWSMNFAGRAAYEAFHGL